MIGFFESLQSWHWLLLAITLFGIEMLGVNGFLLGAGAAAVLLALIIGFVPELTWPYQLLLYGLLALVLTFCYWYWLRQFNTRTDAPKLNDRAAQMVGMVINLPDGLIDGQGRVQVGDTFWQLRAEASIDPGSRVIVIASEGMTLRVKLH